MKTPFHSALSLLVFLLSSIATYALAPTGLKFRVPCTRWSVPISHCWVPWLATLILLIFQALTPKDVAVALAGDDNIRPTSIIVTYLSLAYLAISCELTGLYSWLALHIARRTHGNPIRQLLAFFGLSGALTAATSPDISLVALTPIMAYTAAASNMDPMALAATHMGASSVCGLMVAVSGPINIIAAQAFGLTFMRFALWMTLPALAAAAVMFGVLYLLLHRRRLVAVRHRTSAATAPPPYPDPVLVLHDQVGAAWCAAALCGCLLALAAAPSLRWREWVVAAVFAAAAVVYNGLAATAAAWGPLGAVIGRRSAYERRQQLQAEMVALGLHPALTDEDLADLLLSAAQHRSTSLTRLAAAAANRLTTIPTATAVASAAPQTPLSQPPLVRYSSAGGGGGGASSGRRQFSASGVGAAAIGGGGHSAGGFGTPSRSGSFSYSVASGTGGGGGGGASLATGPVRQWFSRRWSSLRGWTVPAAVSGELIEAATDAGADLRILGDIGTAGAATAAAERAGGGGATNVRHHQSNATHSATVSNRGDDDAKCRVSEELQQLLTRGTSAAPDALEWWAAVAYSAQELLLRRGSRGPSANGPTGQGGGSSLASQPHSHAAPWDGLAPYPSTVPLLLDPGGRYGDQPSAVVPSVPGALTRRSVFASAAAAATVAAAPGGCELLAGPVPPSGGCRGTRWEEGGRAGGTGSSAAAGEVSAGGGEGVAARTPSFTALAEPSPPPPLPQPPSSSSWYSALSTTATASTTEPLPYQLNQIHSHSSSGNGGRYLNTPPVLHKFGPTSTMPAGGGSGSVALSSPLGPRREPSAPQTAVSVTDRRQDAVTPQAPSPPSPSPPAAASVAAAPIAVADPSPAPAAALHERHWTLPTGPSPPGGQPPVPGWRREAAATAVAACPTDDEAAALLPSRGPDRADGGGSVCTRSGDGGGNDGGGAPGDTHLGRHSVSPPPSRSFKTERPPGLSPPPPPPPLPSPPPGGSGPLIAVNAVASSSSHTSSSLGYGSGGSALSGRLMATSSYGVDAVVLLGSGGGVGRSGGGCGGMGAGAGGGGGGCGGRAGPPSRVAGGGSGGGGGAASCGAPQRRRAPSLTLLLLAPSEVSFLGTLAALPWSHAVLLAGSCVMTEALQVHGWIGTLTSFLNALAGVTTPSPSTPHSMTLASPTHSHMLPASSLPSTPASSPGLVASVVFSLGWLTTVLSLVLTGQTATLILVRALNRPTFLAAARSPLAHGALTITALTTTTTTSITTTRATTTSPGGSRGALRGAQLAVVLGANLAPALALSGSLTALRWGLGLRQLGLKLRCGRYLAGGLVPAAVAAGAAALVVAWGQCAA